MSEEEFDDFGYSDMPQIQVFARETKLEKISKAVDVICGKFDPDLVEVRFNEVINDEQDQSIITGKAILEKVLGKINELGGFTNLDSALFYWGMGNDFKPNEKHQVAYAYIPGTLLTDSIADLFYNLKIFNEIKNKGFENFLEVFSVELRSNDPLFMHIAKNIVPIFADNDQDYAIIIGEPVTGNSILLSPSAFNALSNKDIIERVNKLSGKKNEYMKTDKFRERNNEMKRVLKSFEL